jgi:hypothetical protein
MQGVGQARGGCVVRGQLDRAALVELPDDVYRAIKRLVAAHGINGTRERLGVGKNTLEEMRLPRALIVPRTLDRIRARLVTLGALTAFTRAS